LNFIDCLSQGEKKGGREKKKKGEETMFLQSSFLNTKKKGQKEKQKKGIRRDLIQVLRQEPNNLFLIVSCIGKRGGGGGKGKKGRKGCLLLKSSGLKL